MEFAAESPEEPRRPKLRQRARLPLLSGKATALVVVLLFGLTAILIPVAVRLPVWIDAEIVVTAWWLIWIGVLTYLLSHGHRVSHDYEHRPPRSWWSFFKNFDGFDIPDPFVNVGDAEGCLVLLLIIFVVLPLVLLLLWFLVEVAIPLVVFLLYLLVRGMLAHVANDTHDCQGRLDRAMLWALTWATLYTAPLGLVVWFVHVVVAK